MTTRRGFLAAALAACAAPAYVKAGILMPVKKVLAPPGVITLAQFDAILDQLRPNPLFRGGLSRWNGLELYDGVQWTPDQISATDWPKVAALQDEYNRRARAAVGLMKRRMIGGAAP